MTNQEERKDLCVELAEIENDLVRQLLRVYTRHQLRRVLGASRKASGLQRIEKELLWLTAFSVVALPSANSYVVAATSDQFVGRKLSLVSSFPDVGQNSLLASPIAVDTPL